VEREAVRNHELNEAMRKAAIPPQMRHLPISPTGFLVPWFVQWFADETRTTPTPFGVGVPEFRCLDSGKIEPAIRRRLCWVCGGMLGRRIAFMIGPMCAVSRVTSEPGCHRDCAVFSATACPFLSNPRMRRNEKALPGSRRQAAGVPLDRNPGVACVWITREFRRFRPVMGNAGLLIRLGEPDSVSWHAHGAEVLESIESISSRTCADDIFPVTLAVCAIGYIFSCEQGGRHP